MIFCFTGTGNSRKVADELQESLGDDILRLPPGLMRDPSRIDLKVADGRVIWVLPVHSWGLPWLVEKVIRLAKIQSENPKTDLKHYLVCTCGDDIGETDKQWRRLMESRGWHAASAWSVQTPNSYVAMKGFDVDPQNLTTAKLVAATTRVADIARQIEAGADNVTDVVRGSFPWIKSRVIRPWFIRRMTRTAPFHATEACVGCGRCARNCPLGIISMVDDRPHWQRGNCIMCLRCYHCCPQHAVAYGKATDGKGQYLCPGYRLK